MDAELIPQRTVATIMHIYPDGSTVREEYHRDGEFQVQEQVTSWGRECMVAFWKQLKDSNALPR